MHDRWTCLGWEYPKFTAKSRLLDAPDSPWFIDERSILRWNLAAGNRTPLHRLWSCTLKTHVSWDDWLSQKHSCPRAHTQTHWLQFFAAFILWVANSFPKHFYYLTFSECLNLELAPLVLVWLFSHQMIHFLNITTQHISLLSTFCFWLRTKFLHEPRQGKAGISQAPRHLPESFGTLNWVTADNSDTKYALGKGRRAWQRWGFAVAGFDTGTRDHKSSENYENK